MDEASHGVASNEAQKPKDQKNCCDGGKHNVK